jgi:hypothetical protein
LLDEFGHPILQLRSGPFSVDTLVHAEQFLGLDGEGSMTAPAAVRDSSHGRPNRRCGQTSNRGRRRARLPSRIFVRRSRTVPAMLSIDLQWRSVPTTTQRPFPRHGSLTIFNGWTQLGNSGFNLMCDCAAVQAKTRLDPRAHPAQKNAYSSVAVQFRRLWNYVRSVARSPRS